MAEALTLGWLYGQSDLDLRPLHRGAEEFTVVQPSELVETAEFVQPGAVILTVGVALRADRIDAYVQRLREAGAVAIGYGTGLVEDRVPAALVAAAGAAGLSVFEVPRRVPFTAILSAVQEEYARRRLQQQQRLLDFQEVLNDIAVEHGVVELVDTAALHLAATVLVIDNDGRLVVGHGGGPGERQALAERALDKGGRSATFRVAGRTVLVHRMSTEGDRFHLLIAAADEPFTAQDRSVIKHVAGLAEIILQRPLRLRRTASELHTLALSLLLGVEREGAAISDVFSTAVDSAGRLRPVVIHAQSPQLRTRALAELDISLMRSGRQLFALRLGETDALVVFRGSRDVADIVGLFGARAREIGIAVGETVYWQDLSLSLVDGLADTARSLRPGGHVGPENEILRWVAEPAVRQAMQPRFAGTYRKLLDHDADHGTDLARTVDAYLRAGSQVAAAADALGVHRHTVRTRLEQAEAVSGLTLSDPLVAAEMLLMSMMRGEVG